MCGTKEHGPELPATPLLAERAYADRAFQEQLAAQGTPLVITHIFSVLHMLFLALKGLWILAGDEALRVTTGKGTHIIAL
jgi:hypothetical protein